MDNEQAQIEGVEPNKDIEVAPALISVHPTDDSVAVAVGSDLRVFDLRGNCGISLVDEPGEAFHKDSIRAIRYGCENGRLFVSAGDDKLVKVWDTRSWHCVGTVLSEKRVSAVAISNDGNFICFADKFGVVWVIDVHGLGGNEVSVNKKPASLLSHYCSIITSLQFSPDGKFIVSADRDFKIRVSMFPKNPLDGAHEIQSYCLGHTEFVSCLDFVCAEDSSPAFLVSGSGDSAVRLWDITTGAMLDTCEVRSKTGILESRGNEESCFAITDLCTIKDSNLVAAAVQGLQGIILFSCELPSQTLSIKKVFDTMGENFIPTSLASCRSSELLWMITGVSKISGSDYNSLARVRVLSGFFKSILHCADHELIALGDNEVPGGEKLLKKLQGSVLVDQNFFVAAAEAVKTAMSNLLIKKQYPSEKREFRKRTRNDKKIKQ